MKFSELYAECEGITAAQKEKWWVFVSMIKNLITVLKPGRILAN